MSTSIQLGLFDETVIAPSAAPNAKLAPLSGADQPVVRLSLGPKLAARPRRRPPQARLLTERDMPAYSHDEICAVDRIISGMKSERLFLGYRDIADLFGVSKATVNRRMKEGLVPGVTIQDGVVTRDGGVRRFSREQVKWLLLAVRANQNGRMA